MSTVGPEPRYNHIKDDWMNCGKIAQTKVDVLHQDLESPRTDMLKALSLMYPERAQKRVIMGHVMQ